MRSLTLCLTLLVAVLPACGQVPIQADNPLPALQTNPSTQALSSQPNSPRVPHYPTYQMPAASDDLLQIQRHQNAHCAPAGQTNSYLPNVTFVLKRSGELSYGTGNSVSLEASNSEGLHRVQLSADDFAQLQEQLNQTLRVLQSGSDADFSVLSPLTDPPDYRAGECAIFEAFDFLLPDSEGKRLHFARPDFELYQAPESLYRPADIAALDQLKQQLLALKQKYGV